MKIILSILLSVILFSAKAQFTGTDSLRNYNNRYITNNPATAFTNLRLNTLIRGVIDWVDTARAGTGGGGALGVDTLWALNDSTVRYRKSGVFRNMILKGVYDTRRKVDTAYALNDSTLQIKINGTNRNIILPGRHWTLQGVLNNGSTLTENEVITLADSLTFTSGLVVIGSLNLPSLTNQVDTTTYKPLVVDAAGNPHKMAGWPGSGGSAVDSTGWLYIESFGARGDGKDLYDCAITASDATLTSATAAFTAADIGKYIRVDSAGTSGGDLVTTIASINSSTSVELTATASTTVNPAHILYGTDNTTPIQNAINFAASSTIGTKTIYFRNGMYLVAGAALHSVSGVDPNAQLYIPLSSIDNTDSAASIRLLGETPPSLFIDFQDASYPTNKGVILRSTRRDSAANIIGSPWETILYGDYNYSHLWIENMTLRVRSITGFTHVKPIMTGVDGGRLSMLSMTNCRVDTESPTSLSITPDSLTSGVVTPKVNNADLSYYNNLVVQGCWNGVVVGENANFVNLTTMGNWNGVVINTTHHAAKFSRASINLARHNIRVTGQSRFVFDLVDFEDWGVGGTGGYWFDNLYDLYEDVSTSEGFIRYQRVIGGVGGDNTVFNRNLANYKVTVIPVGQGLPSDHGNIGTTATAVNFKNNQASQYSALTIYNNADKYFSLGSYGSGFAGTTGGITNNNLGVGLSTSDNLMIGLTGSGKRMYLGSHLSTTDSADIMIDPDGDVAIGFISGTVDAKLHVKKNIDGAALMLFENPNTGSNAFGGIQIKSDVGSSYMYRTSGAYGFGLADATVLQDAGGGDIAIFGDASEIARFKNGGGVDINGDATVADEAYDATAWDGSLEVPTKNSIRDKIESLSGGITSINSMTGPAITITAGTGITTSSASNDVEIAVDVNNSVLPHTIDKQFIDANNTGTGETDLYTKSVAANTLGSNGQSLSFEVGGVFNDATATANLQLYFAGTAFAGTGAMTLTGTGAWRAQGSIIRVSSSVYRATVTYYADNTSQKIFTSSANVTSVDFTTSNIFKITGTAAGAGGGSNDITAQMWIVRYDP
jgi:hypothetical protein